MRFHQRMPDLSRSEVEETQRKELEGSLQTHMAQKTKSPLWLRSADFLDKDPNPVKRLADETLIQAKGSSA